MTDRGVSGAGGVDRRHVTGLVVDTDVKTRTRGPVSLWGRGRVGTSTVPELTGLFGTGRPVHDGGTRDPGGTGGRGIVSDS